MKTVLVVSDSPRVREVASQAFEPLEYEVMFCPGPRGPTYVCIGGRGGRCALAVGADAIVLDASLTSDQMPEGTPVWRLFTYYLGLGKPVVVLASPGDLGELGKSEAVEVLPRTLNPEALYAAVKTGIYGPSVEGFEREIEDA